MMAETTTTDVDELRQENKGLPPLGGVFAQALHRLHAKFMEFVANARPDDKFMDLLEDMLTNAPSTINANNNSLLVLDKHTEELVFVISQGDVKEAFLH